MAGGGVCGPRVRCCRKCAFYLTRADMDSLENVLRNAVAEGQPRTHRPWKKIVVRGVGQGLSTRSGDRDLRRPYHRVPACAR